jgi:molybdenum cofactor guanylyltransferase
VTLVGINLNINCIILAGGKSLRLGHDKLLETIGYKSLIELAVSHIESLCNKIIIVTAGERTFPMLASHPEVKIINDIFPGKGSLGGIYSGLVESDSFYNLVIASDMPFLNQPLLRHIIEVSDGFDFVLPHVNNMFEPLHAVYSKGCVSPIEFLMGEDKKVILELFGLVRVKHVEAEEIDRFDPKHLSFFNVNTKEDLVKAREIAREISVNDKC